MTSHSLDGAESQLPFWDDLTQAQRELVAERSLIKHFAKDEVVNRADSSYMGLVLILSGGIRAYRGKVVR